jgi:hypothetical protein
MEPTADALRLRAWRARRRRERRQICLECQGIFVPLRAEALFCGRTCSRANYRRRRATGEAAITLHRKPEPPFRIRTEEPVPQTRAVTRPGRIDIASLIG